MPQNSPKCQNSLPDPAFHQTISSSTATCSKQNSPVQSLNFSNSLGTVSRCLMMNCYWLAGGGEKVCRPGKIRKRESEKREPGKENAAGLQEPRKNKSTQQERKGNTHCTSEIILPNFQYLRNLTEQSSLGDWIFHKRQCGLHVALIAKLLLVLEK